MPVNIEIKAHCNDPAFVAERLQQLHADHKGTDHQVDTYFKVEKGRLKLREGNIENNLIYYLRNNQVGPKKSEVILYPSGSDGSLKDILGKVLGIMVVVDKHRDIYFIDKVKFHIDRVKGLGSFVEIEAIGEAGDEEELGELCARYMELLHISDDHLIDVSYSDLLMNKENDEIG